MYSPKNKTRTIIDPIAGFKSLLKTYNLNIIQLLIETNSVQINMCMNIIEEYYMKNAITDAHFIIKLSDYLIDAITSESVAQVLINNLIMSCCFSKKENLQNNIPLIRRLIDKGASLSNKSINLFVLPDELFFEHVEQNELVIDANTELNCMTNSSTTIMKWLINKSTNNNDIDTIYSIIQTLYVRYIDIDNKIDFREICIFYMQKIYDINSDYLNLLLLNMTPDSDPNFYYDFIPIGYTMDNPASLLLLFKFGTNNKFIQYMSPKVIEYQNINFHGESRIIYENIMNSLFWFIDSKQIRKPIITKINHDRLIDSAIVLLNTL